MRVGWRIDPLAHLDAESLEIIDRFAVRAIRVLRGLPSGPSPCHVTEIHDPSGVLATWFEASSGRLALVRPDRHVYAIFNADEGPDVLSRFATFLDPSSQARPGSFLKPGRAGTDRG